MGDGSFRPGAGDCHLRHGSTGREERELFAFEKTVLQPAPEVISNGLGVTHLLVAGPARWLKAGVGHFAAQHFHGHAMLQRH